MSLFREGPKPAPISMRRVLAFIFGIASLPVFGLGAFNGNMTAIWAGYGLLVTTVILLFFTTWSDLSDAAAKIKGAL